MALLEMNGLKKYFPITKGIIRHVVGHLKALDGVDVALEEGEVVGVVGETGCGKSTLGRTAIRLLKPTAGRVLFHGKDVMQLSSSELKRFRMEVQIVFQDPFSSLNPRKTIGHSISESLYYHGIAKSRSEQTERAAEILKTIGMSPDVMNRYPHQFSGGQQQRICIGRAIALSPKLIVCDEALSALDVSIQAQILNLLIDLKGRLGLSYLFISHDLSVVRYISDRVVVLYLGKVMESARAGELFANPKHPYTQALLAAAPKSHPSEEKFRAPLKGEVPSPINPPGGCPFRTRCPFAQPICAETPPKKVIKDKETGGEHIYHCILD